MEETWNIYLALVQHFICGQLTCFITFKATIISPMSWFQLCQKTCLEKWSVGNSILTCMCVSVFQVKTGKKIIIIFSMYLCMDIYHLSAYLSIIYLAMYLLGFWLFKTPSSEHSWAVRNKQFFSIKMSLSKGKLLQTMQTSCITLARSEHDSFISSLISEHPENSPSILF